MKKFCLIAMLITFAAMCSCRKQDTTAEQQLAQRKVELDTRENALAERESSLDARETALNEREKALAEKEKAMMKARTIPTDVQNPAEAEAERDRLIQQLPASLPSPSQLHAEKAEKERKIEEQRGQSQSDSEMQSYERRKAEAIRKKWQMSGVGSLPAPAQVTSPPQSSAEQATSPGASPTPE